MATTYLFMIPITTYISCLWLLDFSIKVERGLELNQRYPRLLARNPRETAEEDEANPLSTCMQNLS